MRRIILIIFCLLFSVFAYSGPSQQADESVIAVMNSSQAAFCTSCTGPILFCWEITADDVDITNSGGCSVGDTIATLASAANLAANPSGPGYVVNIPGTYDFASFDISLEDIFDPDIGTLEFDIYITSDTAVDPLIEFIGLPSVDTLIVKTALGADQGDLILEYTANSTTVSLLLDCNYSFDTWYTVTAKWRTGSTPTLSLTANSVTATTNSSLVTPWINTPTLFSIGPGDGFAGGTVFDVKNIKIWNTWQ